MSSGRQTGEDNVAVWLFGSCARNDFDESSDLDVLVMSDDGGDHPSPHVPTNATASLYSWEEIEAMSRYGSLFLWHIKLEGRPLFEGESVRGRLLKFLAQLPPYQLVERDLSGFLQFASEVEDAVDDCIRYRCDVEALAKAGRHVSILASYIGGEPCFSRTGAYASICRLHPELTREVLLLQDLYLMVRSGKINYSTSEMKLLIEAFRTVVKGVRREFEDSEKAGARNI